MIYQFQGDCCCARYVINSGTPEKPKDHKVNTTSFEVGLKGSPDAEQFKNLVAPIIPARGEEKSYLTLGAVLGDQGFALQVMALGHLLGIWQLLSPDTLMPDLAQDIKLGMAEQGMVTITGN